jgi:hypothetical protein
MDDATTKTDTFEEIDVSTFDETLKEIDQILNNIEQKINIEHGSLEKNDILPEIKSAVSKIYGAKNELLKEEKNLINNSNLVRRVEKLEKNINSSADRIVLSKELNAETTNEIKEHEIDQTLLSIEELDHFKNNNEKKKTSSFSFYSYLVLAIIIFFILYGTLNVSKNLIISKYPVSGTYIQYFYEIIEILKVSILGFIGLITNKI